MESQVSKMIQEGKTSLINKEYSKAITTFQKIKIPDNLKLPSIELEIKFYLGIAYLDSN
jgi:hypothetical protein